MLRCTYYEIGTEMQYGSRIRRECFFTSKNQFQASESVPMHSEFQFLGSVFPIRRNHRNVGDCKYNNDIDVIGTADTFPTTLDCDESQEFQRLTGSQGCG